jgi:hypothetical protein
LTRSSHTGAAAHYPKAGIPNVIGQARSDQAGLRTKLANDNSYAVGKLQRVFGDQPVQNILE